jgi:hypothetical protein
MYIRCSRCLGAKTVMGMGSIYRECEVCKGVGMIKQEPKPESNQEQITRPYEFQTSEMTKEIAESVEVAHCPVGETPKAHTEARSVKKQKGAKNG